ncbi:alpha/beta hydrolase [Sporolactobacillus kofuensis]|uniref:Alpha/beta hydrolase n=1 Tax=Sporolactobacillus kofuensis TaxID=269672 RepID=A0ABW1WGA3_9BACL|nr:alpha/beta fold hydrolase [Sporolactobacillus kofuensis]MCO7176535.1 alpha/beta fold hydrolase [Sporolactobacillus kofuensis]
MAQPLCVIIHGFAGSPWEIEPLAHALKQAGYEVITPLLPGHSMDRGKMEKIKALEWLKMVEAILKKAIDDKRTVHLIGFSMGGMIASIMACRYQIATLVLLSPAVYVITPHVVKMRLGMFFQVTLQHSKLADKSIMNHQLFTQFVPIHNLFQFRKVVRQAKRIFQHISVPVCIIHGKKDETVDPKSSDLIYRTVSSHIKELHYLPLSGHHICQGRERDQVIQMVLTFLEN